MFHGAQVTVCSTSVSGYYDNLRLAGAQARKMLIANAAAEWKVPAAELTTANGMVMHAKSNRKISYGDIAKFATVPAEPPKITKADLKKPAQFKSDRPHQRQPHRRSAKGQRQRQYGIDADVPGMVYACVLQAPAEGAKAAVSNLDDVAKMKDIAAVIPLPFGVAVIGGSVEATRAGRNALKVTWDMAESPAKGFDSAKAMEDYANTANDPKAPVRVATKVGPTKEILSGAKVKVEAAYSSQYVYHAQMEPMNAVALVAEDGKSAEIWTGTQFAALISYIVSTILKTTPDKIVVHQKFLGGGYGRRLGPDTAIQAVILSSIVKKPVKLILTREDDLAAARVRPMTYHTLKAGLDGNNNLIAWYHRMVAENVDFVANPPAFCVKRRRRHHRLGGSGADRL